MPSFLLRMMGMRQISYLSVFLLSLNHLIIHDSSKCWTTSCDSKCQGQRRGDLILGAARHVGWSPLCTSGWWALFALHGLTWSLAPQPTAAHLWNRCECSAFLIGVSEGYSRKDFSTVCGPSMCQKYSVVTMVSLAPSVDTEMTCACGLDSLTLALNAAHVWYVA